MRRGWWLSGLLILVFAAVVIARLPARWLTARLPAELRCTEPSGTLWQGSCVSLALREQPLGGVSWQLHPFALLGATLAADVHVDGPGLTLATALKLRRNGDLSMHDLKLTLELPTALIARLSGDLSGHVTAELATLQIESGWLRDLRGRIELTELFSGGREPAPLGNFELLFEQPPVAGKIVGALRDLGGPLDVRGSLTLGSTPGYLLEGTAAARQEANDALRQQLQLLGPADASGRHRFAQEAAL